MKPWCSYGHATTATKALLATSIKGIDSHGVEGYDKVLIPGDPEREMEAIHIKDGIPLVESVAADL